MKVFISWSGTRSKAVAEQLSDWLKCVIQALRPWISNRDIDRGALWFNEISDQLKDTAVGIVCLTQENKNKPWILFETGALAKGLSSNRVCTFLIDLKPSDLEDPLAQFNHTLPDRESMWGMVRTLNGCLGSTGLDERILDLVFNNYWDQFDNKFKEIINNNPPSEKTKPRTDQNLLSEILENTRYLGQKIRSLELRANRTQETDVAFEFKRLANPAKAQAMVEELYSQGLSQEEILTRLRSSAPRSFLLREINRLCHSQHDSVPGPDN